MYVLIVFYAEVASAYGPFKTESDARKWHLANGEITNKFTCVVSRVYEVEEKE